MPRRAQHGDTYVDEINGYIVECVRGHPLFPGRIWVYQHRRIMAEKLGRRLLSSEIVHHRNDDGFDNRRRNLKLTTRGAHAKHHKPHGPVEWTPEARRRASASAKLRCTPAWRAAVSERVKEQHAQGRFGRNTWKEGGA